MIVISYLWRVKSCLVVGRHINSACNVELFYYFRINCSPVGEHSCFHRLRGSHYKEEMVHSNTCDFWNALVYCSFNELMQRLIFRLIYDIWWGYSLYIIRYHNLYRCIHYTFKFSELCIKILKWRIFTYCKNLSLYKFIYLYFLFRVFNKSIKSLNSGFAILSVIMF